MNPDLQAVKKAADYLADSVTDLDDMIRKCESGDVKDTLTEAFKAREALTAAALYLTMARDAWDNLLADAMGRYELAIDGVGVVRRHKNARSRNWQSEDLLRAVLDTRLVDDEGTFIDETPLDKIRDVYGLGGYQARIGKLKARGLDPDEWCESESTGWKIQVI